jgi:RNA polymerase sigma-70 factor (ECF subfamily)
MMSVEPVSKSFDVDTCPSAFVELAEQRLLACARGGDAAAFESLVMPHRDAILRLARRILRNQEDAEDVVQIALLEAFRHLNAFQGRSRFSSWLHRIATNAALMRLRSSRHKCEMSLDQIIEGEDRPAQFHVVESRPNPEQECSAKEVRAVLGEAIDRLRPLYKEVVHLCDVQELSAKEAARILEVPVGTVKARAHRARRKLTQAVRLMLATKRRQAVIRDQRGAALFIREPRAA